MDTIEGAWLSAFKSFHLLTICLVSFPNTSFEVSTFAFHPFALLTAFGDSCIQVHSCHAHEEVTQKM